MSVVELPDRFDLQSGYRFDTDLDAAMGRLNAATAAVVEVMRRCLAAEWWQVEETNSPEHWVMARCGLDRVRARRLVAIAGELEAFPATAAAFAAGQLTEAHVFLIVTECDPRYDRPCRDPAGNWNIAQLRRMCRVYAQEPEPEPEASEDPECEAPARDVVSFGWNDTGRFAGRFDVGAELGALLEKGLTAARATLFADRTGIERCRVG